MTKDAKEAIIEEIELEVCMFGSTLIALREFRRATGNRAIRKLAELRAYLWSLTTEALDPLAAELKRRLELAAFPRPI